MPKDKDTRTELTDREIKLQEDIDLATHEYLEALAATQGYVGLHWNIDPISQVRELALAALNHEYQNYNLITGD